MSRLLDGVVVLESAQLVPGDRLGMLLADLGADVIKIEDPLRGDQMRDYPGQITPHHSPAHLQLNKGKRSVTLNLKAEEGLAIFWRLLSHADVFVDGNAPGACARLGLGYKDQAARKPDIIHCQVTGYGATGPYTDIPAHSEMMNALAGATSLRDAVYTAPVVGALYVAAALHQRARTGAGCSIDVSAAEVALTNAFLPLVNALNEDRITDRSTMPTMTPGAAGIGARYGSYETADGRSITFCAIEAHFWEKFCRVVGREDLAKPGLVDGPVEYGDAALRRELEPVFAARDLADWIALAREHRLPLGPNVTDVEDLRSDSHHSARGVFCEGSHRQAGPFTFLREAAVVQGQDYELGSDAPALGEHTREVLAGLGYDAAGIDELAAAGVI